MVGCTHGDGARVAPGVLGVRLSLCALPFGSAETRRGRAARVAVGLSLLGLVTGSTFTLLLGGAQDRARD